MLAKDESKGARENSRRGRTHRTTEKGGKGRTGPHRGKQIGRADLTASTPPLPSEGRVLSARQSKQALPLTLMLANVSVVLAAQGGAKALVLEIWSAKSSSRVICPPSGIVKSQQSVAPIRSLSVACTRREALHRRELHSLFDYILQLLPQPRKY